MANTIRDDLDGVVTVHKDGQPITLYPGDTVPAGVTVDSSLLGADAAGIAENPGEFKVAEVNAYLAEHPDEVDAVLKLEAAGEGRKGILEGPHAKTA